MTTAILLPLLAAASTAAGGVAQDAPKAFSYTGVHVEGCSCPPPCPCELFEVAMSCQGVGGFDFKTGTYDGKSISGSKLAYGVAPGSWVTIYLDAPTPAKRDALEALARSAFKAWGELKFVKDADISITRDKGIYTMTVDGGKVMTLITQPVLGLDTNMPIVISNVRNPLYSTVMLGTTAKCQYNDGERSFDFKGTNAYFNGSVTAKGKI